MVEYYLLTQFSRRDWARIKRLKGAIFECLRKEERGDRYGYEKVYKKYKENPKPSRSYAEIDGIKYSFKFLPKKRILGVFVEDRLASDEWLCKKERKTVQNLHQILVNYTIGERIANNGGGKFK